MTVDLSTFSFLLGETRRTRFKGRQEAFYLKLPLSFFVAGRARDELAPSTPQRDGVLSPPGKDLFALAIFFMIASSESHRAVHRAMWR